MVAGFEKTFEPYEDKVKIINKWVSSVNDENHTTLEAYIEKHMTNKIIIKMDIEGMEKEVIYNSFGKYMGVSNICFSCCTYHKADDANDLKKEFELNGYSTEFSDGFMLFFNETPYFRKGIIRAWKNL